MAHVELEPPEPEARKPHAPLRQERRAKGMGIVDDPVMISVLPRLWAESSHRGPARKPKDGRVTEQGSEVGVARESLIPATQVDVIPAIHLILVVEARSGSGKIIFGLCLVDEPVRQLPIQ